MSNRLLILFACNDHRNGVCRQYFDAAEVGGVRLDGPPTRVRYVWTRPPVGGRMLAVGRLRVPSLGFSSWVGNWCWDGAAVTPPAALKVLRYLHGRGFEPVEAPSEVWDGWRELEPDSDPSRLAALFL